MGRQRLRRKRGIEASKFSPDTQQSCASIPAKESFGSSANCRLTAVSISEMTSSTIPKESRNISCRKTKPRLEAAVRSAFAALENFNAAKPRIRFERNGRDPWRESRRPGSSHAPRRHRQQRRARVCTISWKSSAKRKVLARLARVGDVLARCHPEAGAARRGTSQSHIADRKHRAPTKPSRGPVERDVLGPASPSG